MRTLGADGGYFVVELRGERLGVGDQGGGCAGCGFGGSCHAGGRCGRVNC